jgi:putative membrane protein
VFASVLGGLVGGLIGAAVMSAGHALITTIAGDGPDQLAKGDQEEDATVKVADRFSRTLRGRPLGAHEKTAASHLVHYGFGAVMGAVYGAAASVRPAVAVGGGTAFGAAVWLGAHVTVVPALGLARSPLREPPAKEARELILHLAYGVTVALVRNAAVRTSR